VRGWLPDARAGRIIHVSDQHGEEGYTMQATADLKRQMWNEIEQLTPDELERLYKLVLFVKDEFMDVSGEERYLTASWQQAEQEATETHQQGDLPGYDTVDEMMDAILNGVDA
jgi:hypothetical protein